MSAQPKARMTVDEFLAWAEHQPGRHELVDGEVYAMSPQRVRHAETKFSVQLALRTAIREAGLPCRMLPDGLTVRIDAATSFEPDALVYCGERLDADATEAPEPIIVVEVLSPSTGHVDTGQKLAGYFRVPSVMHYLIVDPRKAMVIHHRRGADDLIETRIASAGVLDLHPPGLRIPIAELFAVS
ncbi:Uma2 family endonuclease [Methylobacterium sp. BTF04]|uniref:Uma2 family endonuclease n=1 Tax=Methylobacterium sp. BTF04 TaxID=2708300 RepID=UPI0013D32736|nr:Uma2 family endonuclease [Methylobacterium sp. BTF04]NEU11806.1 Uma2 family endonuclease [Methylobacterium sp. BTF04]